ncbi:hypothetical protein QKT49_gp259 [Acanthamoeba castellanii medusavirus]|uniref:Uncharacterized protein n=1 Tax=Acanthamoeba castellanii medusavirus J1 TaxID=3114988 RepID=A0A3T1CXF0_9VIRU|nr:hypothetical protein QKT49_gp259 [Acanthamoeba castellanii medusavirus]BBI30504.1 hypothetical protein [Acanthamoeba castellanii medusavirus J1]
MDAPRQRQIYWEMSKELFFVGAVMAGASFLTARGATVAARLLPPSHVAHRIARSRAIVAATVSMTICSGTAFAVPVVFAFVEGTTHILDGFLARAEKRVDMKEKKTKH